MIQGGREEKCCLQANPRMPRGGEPFDEACTHWEKGIIDLARVSLLNNIRKSFTDCFIHKNVIKVLSGLSQKVESASQTHDRRAITRTWFSGLLCSVIFFFSKTRRFICFFSLVGLLSRYCVKHFPIELQGMTLSRCPIEVGQIPFTRRK